jgi:hypothetical protein
VNRGAASGGRQRALFGMLAVTGLLAGQPAVAGGETGLGELRQLIGDAACVSDAQCRTVAIGASACGGPAAYLAWSTLRTDAAAVRQAAERYTRRSAVPPRRGDASTCRVLADPGAVCRPAVAASAAAAAAPTGRCTLRGSGGPAAAPAQ